MGGSNINLVSLKKSQALAPYSWWKIGGPADYFAEISSEQELASLLAYLNEHSVPWCFIGNGTNILFDDEGFRGCIIRFSPKFSSISQDRECLLVQSGAWTPKVAVYAAHAGFSGIEHTIGIPATFGGLVYMNGGSQRKGIGDLIETVRILSPDGTIRDISRSGCNFNYRYSRFQSSNEIILSATIRFTEHREYSQQRPELLKILRERRLKFPRKLPSCGSVFKSSPELYQAYGPPGKIIEELGFKGLRRGNIEVSPHHANFIVNTGMGRSRDVLDLVRIIHTTVLEKTGLRIEPEFQYCHPKYGFQKATEWL